MMIEFLKDFFTTRDAFARSMRALAVALAAGMVSPEVQAALVAALGPYGAIVVPMLVGAFGGAVAVGERNEKREESETSQEGKVKKRA